MKQKKFIITTTIFFLMSLGFLTFGVIFNKCEAKNTLKPIKEGYSAEDSKVNVINVVTTTFPYYDFAKNIIGDIENVRLVTLAKQGVDMHSFQPSADDVVNIINSDLFIFTGGEDDLWVKDVFSSIKSNKNKKVSKINCLELLQSNGIKENDEHVWTSIRNVKKFICPEITRLLKTLDPNNSMEYDKNSIQYTKLLDRLDEQYVSAIEKAGLRTVVFADRFPFKYLFNDYNIECHAAFDGCTSESSVDFDTQLHLADEVNEYGVSSILKLTESPDDLAIAVKMQTNSKDQEILSMDSMQSALYKKGPNNDYVDVMYDNLSVLRRALQK